jgi:hypothetical protein
LSVKIVLGATYRVNSSLVIDVTSQPICPQPTAIVNWYYTTLLTGFYGLERGEKTSSIANPPLSKGEGD